MDPRRAVAESGACVMVKLGGIACPAGFFLNVLPLVGFGVLIVGIGAPALAVVFVGVLVSGVVIAWYRPLLVIEESGIEVRNLASSRRVERDRGPCVLTLPGSRPQLGSHKAKLSCAGSLVVQIDAIRAHSWSRAAHSAELDSLGAALEDRFEWLEIRVAPQR